jgi:outer membrane protein assembly factor BamB
MKTTILPAILILAWLQSAAPQEPPCGGNWPQWRGPRRDNVSDEKGLLPAWPEAGPPLFWEVHGLGGGIAAVAVSGGRVFTVGYIGDSEYLTALDEATGRRRWSSRVGPLVQESPLMRWLGQRTPTVDGERVYAFHTDGLLVCFQASTGKELWRKSYTKDFGATRPGWGYCDRPLVDGDRLICAPGGTVSMVALNKVSGEILWTSDVKGGPAHSATVVSEAAGVRQYVTCLAWRVVGIRASDGKQLWTYDNFGRTASSCTTIPRGDTIIATAGYGVGLAVLNLHAAGDGVRVEAAQLAPKLDIIPFQDSGMVVGDHLYLAGNSRSCYDLSSGKVLWTDRSTGRGITSMTRADGLLYVHHSDGTLALAEATPERFALKSSFKIPGWVQATGAANPVVTGGRMYIRNESRLLCYDVRGSAPKSDRTRPQAIVLPPPDPKQAPAAPTQAIYVPTPQDVVEKMLALARVNEGDTVVDLGSGDGRIVITAAKKYKATAVGYEIDEQLVKESRSALEKAGLQDLATIESKDLFTAKLDTANVVAVYLPENFLERLLPQFDQLGCGSRIVSHQFKIPGVEPDETYRMESKDDGELHTILVWTTPLKKKKKD